MKKLFNLSVFTVALLVLSFTSCKQDDNKDKEPIEKNAILIEEFTGQACGYCPSGAKAVHKAMSGIEDKVILVCHHVGFYEDDFTIAASRPLLSYYGPKGTSAPACMVDRTSLNGSFPTFNPLDGSMLNNNMLKKRLQDVKSYVALKLETSLSGSDLTVNVSGELLKELPNARLNVYLTQDKIVAPQTSGGDDYVHPNMIRACLTDQNFGDSFDNTIGAFSKQYTFPIPANISGVKGVPFATDLSNMYVVAFVADFVSNKYADFKEKNIVHNAAISKIQ